MNHTVTPEKKKGPFDDVERAFIREHFPLLTVKDIAQRLHRSALAVGGEANRLGLIKKPRKYKRKLTKEPASTPPRTRARPFSWTRKSAP